MGFAASLFALLVINSVNDNAFGIFSFLIVFLLGILMGAVTGLVHVKLRLPSFIVTFAMGNIARGLGLLTYKTTPPIIKSEAVIAFSQGSFLGVPNVTYVAFAVFILGWIILNYTAFGRAVYAVGDNEVSARAAGINIGRVKILAFVICGGTASIAGIIGSVLFKVGQVSIGDNMLFPTIAAVTVGGLTPGVGGMLQTFIGVLIYTELVNYLTLMGVNMIFKQAIQGVIILFAVAVSATRNRKIIVK
jgi:ribose transport system permease protein